MPDYWRDSGYHLTAPTSSGRLGVTPDLLRAYLLRPELRPVDESDDAERALHARLLGDPVMAVSSATIAALGDADARESYRLWLAFRDRLTAAESLESVYLDLFASGDVRQTPPLFVDHLAHMIVRHVLGTDADPFQARAGELFFRDQRVSLQDGAIFLADQETVDMVRDTAGFGDLGRLLVDSETSPREVEMDVLTEERPDLYWQRDSRYDMVLDLAFARPGLDALCRVMERWVAHFLGAAVSIQPVQKISDERWVWHVGLDVEATSILNDLYHGETLGDDRLRQILSLFRLTFSDPSQMRADLRGRPIYLALAMTPDGRCRLKPQNLLVNLPLADQS